MNFSKDKLWTQSISFSCIHIYHVFSFKYFSINPSQILLFSHFILFNALKDTEIASIGSEIWNICSRFWYNHWKIPWEWEKQLGLRTTHGIVNTAVCVSTKKEAQEEGRMTPEWCSFEHGSPFDSPLLHETSENQTKCTFTWLLCVVTHERIATQISKMAAYGSSEGTPTSSFSVFT